MLEIHKQLGQPNNVQKLDIVHRAGGCFVIFIRASGRRRRPNSPIVDNGGGGTTRLTKTPSQSLRTLLAINSSKFDRFLYNDPLIVSKSILEMKVSQGEW